LDPKARRVFQVFQVLKVLPVLKDCQALMGGMAFQVPPELTAHLVFRDPRVQRETRDPRVQREIPVFPSKRPHSQPECPLT
jgi:hypothetical protein